MENRRQIIEKYVAQNYLKMSAPDMAAHFNCSATTIKSIRGKLGLKVPLALSKKWTGEKNATKTTCSIDDDQYITENYLLKGSKKMARELNFSTTKVLTRMRQLGLVVPEEVKRVRSLDNRFKTGSVPVTKGKKQTDYMTPEAIERTKASRFKRGSKPKNTLPTGTITTRTNYKNGTQKKWISIGTNIWVPLHIHIWENANGKVPAKHCVRFKDGNPLNCEIDNLALISKKDSYRQNSLAGKGLSSEPRIKRPSKRKSVAVKERKKQLWEEGLIRHFEKEAKIMALQKAKENAKVNANLIKTFNQLERDHKKLIAANNRQIIRNNLKIEKWESALILKFNRSAVKFAKQKARAEARALMKSVIKPNWEDLIIKKFEDSAKRNLRRLQKQNAVTRISTEKATKIRKAKPSIENEQKRTERERLFKVKRELEKLQAKRDKERERIERETKSVMPTRKIDESKLVAVRLDAKTVVFVKPGVDPEAVRNKFLSSQSSRSQ